MSTPDLLRMIGRQPRQRPPPWRERSAACDHIHVPGRSAHCRGGCTSSAAARKPCPPASIMRVGVSTLPFIRRDATDRNRTSPFAFTGNKFEFRMRRSSGCIADANIVLNTIAAEEPSARLPTSWKRRRISKPPLHALIRRETDRAPAHHLQRQRIYRRMGGGGDAPRPAEPAEHGGRCAGAGEARFRRAVRASGRVHREGAARPRGRILTSCTPRRSTSRR